MFRSHEICSALSQAQDERVVATLAVDDFYKWSQSDPRVLRQNGVSLSDVRNCLTHLETTYFVRLFAIFEQALRVIWKAKYGKKKDARTKDLLAGCYTRQRMQHDVWQNADEVRDYRNTILHGGAAPPVSLGEAKRRLCIFMSWMPGE